MSDTLAWALESYRAATSGVAPTRGDLGRMPVFRKPALGSRGEVAEYRTYSTGCRWRLGNDGHQALQFELKRVPLRSVYGYEAGE